MNVPAEELLDVVPAAILCLDARGRVTFWNRGASRLFGWSARHAVGRSAARLFDAEPQAWRSARRRVRRRGRWQGELALATRHGARLRLEARWRVRGEYMVGVFTDVTPLHLAGSHLARLRRLESLAAVVSGLAHDVNNILAPILMSSGLLQSLPDDEDHELARVIEASAQRGAALVKEIQAFARALPAPGFPCPPEVVVNQVVRTCRQQFPADLHVTVATPPAGPEILVDPIELYQLLWELCQTARRWLGSAGTLELSLTPAGADVAVTLLARPVTGPAPAGPDTVGETVRGQGGLAGPWEREGDCLRRRLCWPARVAAAAEPRPPLGHGQLVLVQAEPPLRALIERTLKHWGYRAARAGEAPHAVIRASDRPAELSVPTLVLGSQPFGPQELLEGLAGVLP